MRKYLIVYEKGKRNYSAYSPDLPGCVATGKTRQEVEKRMYEAIGFHIDGLKRRGRPIPAGTSSAEVMVLAS